MSATPEQIAADLVKAVGDAIHDHTLANMEWGPLGYDGIAKEVIGMVCAATKDAQAERVRVLEEENEQLKIGLEVAEKLYRETLGMKGDAGYG